MRGEGGNLGIADPLLRDDNVCVLGEVNLRDLYPCSGPDQEFDWPGPPEECERKVDAIRRMIETGWDAPPLFVHLPTLLVADGTHRREALLRLGRERYWAVMWMKRPPLVGRGQFVPGLDN